MALPPTVQRQPVTRGEHSWLAWQHKTTVVANGQQCSVTE